MKTDRVNLYIDGGNFYHLVIKKLGIEENGFDFEAFASFLIDGRIIGAESKRFYKGTVREKEGDLRSKELMSKQTKLFTTLKKGDWEIKTSKLRTRIEELIIDSRVIDYKKFQKLGIEKIRTERMREKGIDVKIASDLLVGAFDDKYDVAIIVSSDSDLVPAIDWVRGRVKKKIEYIGFSIPDENEPEKATKPLMMMFSKTDTQRVLSKIDMEKFIKLKTILVDAVNTFVVNGKINQEMYKLLEKYPNKKIILTNADDKQLKEFGLKGLPYELFTLKHNPDKDDPDYFNKMLKNFNLKPDEVLYFEHNRNAVKSARSLGIKTHHYDKDKKDLNELKQFLGKGF